VLYTADSFEPLTDEPWNDERVRERIREIVAAADEAFDPEGLWPSSEEDAGEPGLSLTTLYSGASGVIWALDSLRRRGHAESAIDLVAAARRALGRWREHPDFPERREPPVRTHASLFSGETGPLAVAWLLDPDGELADDLYGRVRENASSPADELMSGSPGTMLVGRAMLDRTGEERWAEAWRESAEILVRRRDEDGLWRFEPYGRGLGGAHGAATNVHVLLQGGDLLDGDEVAGPTALALRRFAVVENGLANWPMTAEEHPQLAGFDGRIRLQWCYGAGGVVTSATGFLEEDLVLAGAELCWEAGPPVMEKGPGLCHGTAGNGYAFLKVFELTGDERWLERARRFAVHALEQVGRGSGRYSLFTGDIGAALFAADCREARARFPIVDGL
jgi:hypothetical protein